LHDSEFVAKEYGHSLVVTLPGAMSSHCSGYIGPGLLAALRVFAPKNMVCRVAIVVNTMNFWLKLLQ
jgi:hypothetical protein